MYKKTLQIFFSTIALLLICVGFATTSTGPVAAGPDTFIVSRQAGAFPSGREPLLVEALGEATATCAAMKKILKVISTTENSGPYILGNYPKATVVFSCQ
jgi:hypothetical protein